MTADFKQASNLQGKILASGQVTQQLMTVAGSPTGGTWTPSVNGVAAAAVAYNASAATLQTALQAVLASVTVSGSAGGPYTITCPTGTPAVVGMVSNGLTGGTSPTVTISGVDQTIYTVAGSSAVKVATATLHNMAVVGARAIVSVVPSGGTNDGTHRVADVDIPPRDTIILDELIGDMLDAGATIVVACPAAGALTYKVTGAVSS